MVFLAPELGDQAFREVIFKVFDGQFLAIFIRSILAPAQAEMIY